MSEYRPAFPPPLASGAPSQASPRRWLGHPAVNAGLFLATFITTIMAGAFLAHFDSDLVRLWVQLKHHPGWLRDWAWDGIYFAVPLMAILLAHEMGHYLMARHYGVASTLPYFLPGPNLVGTFGAVIVITGRVPNRKALFDIGAAGPLCGLIVTVFTMVAGLKTVAVEPMALPFGGVLFHPNLLLSWVAPWFGPWPEDAMLVSPLLDAACVGFLVTALNLMPLGQLDGGHIAYAAAGKAADVALDFEGLSRIDGKDVGSIARRSSTSWTLKTTGRSGHSSGIFSDYAGYGAIYEQARILDAFRRELPEPNLTYNVGLVLGGASADVNAGETGGAATGKSNVIAAVAVAQGDIRTLSDDQSARVRAQMQAIVSAHLPGTDARLKFADDGYPAMAPTPGNRALLAKLNEVNKALGLEVMAEGDPARRGAGDISFVAADTDGLVGLGAAGEGAHAPGETVDLKSLDIQSRRAALLMYRLSKERRTTH
jgi:membrane-associated protease RseP (regulator of RpoE activity)